MPQGPEKRADCGAKRRLGLVAGAAAACLLPFPASAQSALAALFDFERHEIVSLALTLGILLFAVVVAIAYLRAHRRAHAEKERARGEIARLSDQVARAHALIVADPQVIVTWRDTADPEILGDSAALTGSPTPRLLAFGTWLAPDAARQLEGAVELLRARGEAFALTLRSNRGRHIEAEGRPIAGAAVLRLRELSGGQLDRATLAERQGALEQELEEARGLLAAIPAPIWRRDAQGRLAFANRAYAAAVEARDAEDAVARGLELLDRSVREEASRLHAVGRPFTKRVPAIVAGARHMLDVVEVAGARGAAGIGLDVSEADTLRVELARMVAAHRRTLDELTTAVAIFASDERLVFHNAAYRALFQLDPAFLEDRPTDSAILDRLRAARRLPEQADFRVWKQGLFEAYRALEPKEHRWYLPGGRTLRVVANPNPEGGVTYLFDDISEQMELASRVNALSRTQGETLDALTEAVAVFGSDGRLKLYNPVFARLWKLSPPTLATKPHIDTVAGWCLALVEGRSGGDAFAAIKRAVTSLEQRTPVERRIERVDGSVLELAALPLPDGGTLVTFRDVTDSVNVERALLERNQALVAADTLKNAFVQHVSYELRSPLTTIIGFAQLLDDPAIGPLNTKQHEYVGHITDSSAALLAIINDILDLATIDAGAMQLDLAEVDVRATMEAAVEGVRDRLTEQDLKLELNARADVGSFLADGKRVRQVLFNLLANAIGFSPRGETVTLGAERRDGAIIFRVTDKGPGVPPEIKERIFERFETHTRGSNHRGPGLGLSIVRSFVGLHGGSVSIENAPGGGTVVTCIFPPAAAADHKAAE